MGDYHSSEKSTPTTAACPPTVEGSMRVIVAERSLLFQCNRLARCSKDCSATPLTLAFLLGKQRVFDLCRTTRGNMPYSPQAFSTCTAASNGVSPSSSHFRTSRALGSSPRSVSIIPAHSSCLQGSCPILVIQDKKSCIWGSQKHQCATYLFYTQPFSGVPIIPL